MRRFIFIIGTLAVALLARSADAWCYKEHIQFARIAVERLLDDPSTPADMKTWLKQACTQTMDMAGEEKYFMTTKVGITPVGFEGLLDWVCQPDKHALNDPASVKVEPFGVHERLLHFTDMELFVTGDQKREYRDDLSGKPKASDFPHEMSDPRYIQAGYLPFAVQHSYDQLVKAIRENRLMPANGGSDDHAVHWAGYLAHYLADNTQPQHSTIDYKSQSYFADKRKSPNVHAEVEYRMLDDDKQDYPELRKDFWPLFVAALNEADPTKTTDPWQATVEISLASYDALPLIGRAAMKATGEGGTPDHPEGPAAPFDTNVFFRFRGTMDGKEMSVMEMKAHQTAWAVRRIERVLRQAWDEGHTH
jgi:hypothetical protein